MKKLIFFIYLTGMLAPFQVFSVDLNRSVMKLLTSLSRQYMEQEEEVFFKQSLAVLPFVDSSPLAKQHEIGAVVEELVRREIALSTYFTLTERKNLDKILKEVEFSLSDLASGGVATGTNGSFFELSEWQPGITPYGDSLEMDLASLAIQLGISLSF